MPVRLDNENNVYHIFPVLCERRDELQRYLTENGVQTLIHYPIPPHKQECYSEFSDLSFPITELVHQQELSLPISPTITKDEVFRVIEIINDFK